jgi:hypothetical protein
MIFNKILKKNLMPSFAIASSMIADFIAPGFYPVAMKYYNHEHFAFELIQRMRWLSEKIYPVNVLGDFI